MSSPPTPILYKISLQMKPSQSSSSLDSIVSPFHGAPVLSPSFTPLSFENGDITLRSSDLIDFSVHKIVLSEASHFFRDMFSLPQATQELAVITIDEDGERLDKLLRWMYPSGPTPIILSISEATMLLHASEKLQVDCRAFRAAITSFLSKDPHPLRAWALAERFDFPEARRAAAQRYYRDIEVVPDVLPDELRLVDGLKLMRLIHAKKLAVNSARSAIDELDWSCRYSHEPGEGQRKAFERLITGRSLFDPESTSELIFQLSAATADCSYCRQDWKEKRQHQVARSYIDSILDAVE